MTQVRLAFVDDQQKEIDLFHKAFGSRFEVASGTTFDHVLAQIRSRGNDWKPHLFILDLYFQKSMPHAEGLKALARTSPRFPKDGGKVWQATMNCQTADDRLRQVLDAHQQSPQHGIALAAQVRNKFPKTPIVYYSRTPTIEDYLNCMKEKGVVDLIAKPKGRSAGDRAAEEATMKAAGLIAERFLKARATDPSTLEKVKVAIWKVLKHAAPIVVEKTLKVAIDHAVGK